MIAQSKYLYRYDSYYMIIIIMSTSDVSEFWPRRGVRLSCTRTRSRVVSTRLEVLVSFTFTVRHTCTVHVHALCKSWSHEHHNKIIWHWSWRPCPQSSLSGLSSAASLTLIPATPQLSRHIHVSKATWQFSKTYFNSLGRLKGSHAHTSRSSVSLNAASATYPSVG